MKKQNVLDKKSNLKIPFKKSLTRNKKVPSSKQLAFLPRSKKEHGGSLSVGKRRVLRPMSSKYSLHITLKSHHAIGGRCLFKHKKMILRMMRKSSRLFQVKVYSYAVCGNHLHLLIKGPDRFRLQNFFRVFAGHTAQNILKLCPLREIAGGAPQSQKKIASGRKMGCAKNQRKFWSFLTYSRVVTWGREFKTVCQYIERNVLETLNIIAYKRRFVLKVKPLNKMGIETS